MSQEKEECPICESKKIFFYYCELNLTLYKCSHCMLVFVHPLPNDKEYVDNLEFNYVDLANKYMRKKQQTPHNKKITPEELEQWEKEKALIFKKDLHTLSKYLRGKDKTQLRLLDVGCGEGHFLLEARKEGYICEGVEPSKMHVPHKEYSLKIFNCFLKEFSPSQKYDIVTLLDALEHTKHPHDEIHAIRKLINDDGLLMIRVPNLYWLIFKEKIFRMLMPLGKSLGFTFNPQGLYAPHTHLYNFSKHSLTHLLRQNGFTVIGVEIINASSSTQSLLKKSFYAVYYAIITVLFKLTGINLAISLNVIAKPHYS